MRKVSETVGYELRGRQDPGPGFVVSITRFFSSLGARLPPVTFHGSLITESTNLSLILVTFVLGLLVDRHGGLAGQLAVSVWTWGVFFRLLHTAPAGWRLPFWVCLTWATAGEIFLSLVWGLYTYRLENIPLFIPPGHVLLFYFGLVLAPRVPQAFVAIVPALALAYAGFAWFSGFDTVSVLLTGLFIVCMLQAEGRRLYAVMFVAALLVEIYGTWIGNWVWHAEVPYYGFTSANPPLAAGAFYCALDVLVGMTARLLRARAGGRSLYRRNDANSLQA
jgi:hypothetical protein